MLFWSYSSILVGSRSLLVQDALSFQLEAPVSAQYHKDLIWPPAVVRTAPDPSCSVTVVNGDVHPIHGPSPSVWCVLPWILLCVLLAGLLSVFPTTCKDWQAALPQVQQILQQRRQPSDMDDAVNAYTNGLIRVWRDLNGLWGADTLCCETFAPSICASD